MHLTNSYNINITTTYPTFRHVYFVIFPRKLLRMIPNVQRIVQNVICTQITDLHPITAYQAFDMQFLSPATVLRCVVPVVLVQ